MTVKEVLERLKELENDALGSANDCAKNGDFANALSFKTQASTYHDFRVECEFNHKQR